MSSPPPGPASAGPPRPLGSLNAVGAPASSTTEVPAGPSPIHAPPSPAQYSLITLGHHLVVDVAPAPYVSSEAVKGSSANVIVTTFGAVRSGAPVYERTGNGR